MRPSPDISLVEDPSTYSSHFSWSGVCLSGSLFVLFQVRGVISGKEHSVTKSARAWALMEVRGRKTRLN